MDSDIVSTVGELSVILSLQADPHLVLTPAIMARAVLWDLTPSGLVDVTTLRRDVFVPYTASCARR